MEEGEWVVNIHTGKVGEIGEVLDHHMVEVWYENEDEPIPTFMSDLIAYGRKNEEKTAPKIVVPKHFQENSILIISEITDTSHIWIYFNNARSIALNVYIKLIINNEVEKQIELTVNQEECKPFFYQLKDIINEKFQLTVAIHEQLNPKQFSRWELNIRTQNYIGNLTSIPSFEGTCSLFSLKEKQNSDVKVLDFDWKNLEKAWKSARFYRPEIQVHRPARKLDLHMEKLDSGKATIHPAAILDVQKSACIQYLEAALAHGYSQVVIIHGIGSGKLKNTIREILVSYPEIRKFEALHEGAFLVYF